MQTRLIAVAAAVTFVISAQGPAVAVLLVHEAFDYPDGNLVGKAPSPGPGGTWATHSGTVNAIQVIGREMLVRQNSTSTQDVNIPLNFVMSSGDQLYTAFELTVSATAPVPNAYFAHFLQGGTTTNFTGRLWAT